METILLVDNDEVVRRLLHNYLEQCGYNLLEAQDGEEALLISQLHEGPIHFLITDIVMPKLGGFELDRLLSEIRPNLRRIFISGYPDEALKVTQMVNRPFVLTKPFHPRDLLAALRSPRATKIGDNASN